MDDAPTIRVEGWDDKDDDLAAAARSGEAGAIRRWLLSAVPHDVANSFTEAQLAALTQAIDSRPAARTAVNIRLSIPFFFRRFFLVILAGPERRSQRRLQQERESHVLWTFTNLCAFAFAVLFFVPALLGLAHMLLSALGRS